MLILHGTNPTGISSSFLVDDYGNEVFLSSTDFVSKIAYLTVHSAGASDRAYTYIRYIDHDL